MSLINEEVVVEILGTPHPLRSSLISELAGIAGARYTVGADGRLEYGGEFAHLNGDNLVNREAAIELLRMAERHAVQRGYNGGKRLRPHVYDPFANLNRAEPWIGLEFECGFATPEARQQAMEYALSIADHGVSFDDEGDGAWCCEITFAPEEACRVLDGTAPASLFMKWISDHRELTAEHDNIFLGTHVNFSLSASPADGDRTSTLYKERVGGIVKLLNNTLHRLTETYRVGRGPERVNTRALLFGRSLMYGGFNLQDEGRGEPYIEGKLFRTTYDYERFTDYLTVIREIINAAETAMSQMRSGYMTPHACERGFCYTLTNSIMQPIGTGYADFVTNQSNLNGVGDSAYITGCTPQDYSARYRDQTNETVLVTGRHLPEPFRSFATA